MICIGNNDAKQPEEAAQLVAGLEQQVVRLQAAGAQHLFVSTLPVKSTPKFEQVESSLAELLADSLNT